MKKIIFAITLICFALSLSARAVEFVKNKDTVIKNRLFSISIPQDLKELYSSKKKKDKILIFHKASKKAGFGGFVFGIRAYKNPSDHAVLPGSRKLGELTDKKGNLYDIVLKYPTDVQYDCTKTPEPPETFKLLYDLAENLDIQGVGGSKYFKNQGMKGQDLYKEVLKKYLTTINEKRNSNKIGYAYYDINADGIDELVIGKIAQGAQKGAIYDIYTMVDRKPAHVVSAENYDRYYVCDDTFVCREYSNGAQESVMRVYILIENSTELFPQVSFKYDARKNPKNPYFISYSDDNWENYSKKDFDERKSVFERYERFDFIPPDSEE